MERSKVFFTDFRTTAFGESMPAKLKRLARKAGIADIDMDGKFVAIKMHFGELGNVSYLRPNYAKAVVDGRESFHISLIVDVSPYCDCHAENDAPILPDIGMFASKDPVALDQACADACLAAEPMPNSVLDDHLREEGFHNHHDHFKNTTPESEWETQLIHGERIGLGTRSYELVLVK